MRALLFGAIVGTVLWMASEIFELSGGGFSEISLLITVGAFLLLAIGCWGLHGSQSPERNVLSFSGTLLISLAFAIFAVLTFQLMTGQASPETIESPLFRIGGILMVLGAVVFGIAVSRAALFPVWTGAAMIVLSIGTVAIEAVIGPGLSQNLVNLLLGAILIFMSIHALRAQV